MQRGETRSWALRTAEWSFHLSLLSAGVEEPPTMRLFVKPDDRWEVNDVAQHHPELTENLEKTLRAFIAATRASGSFQPPELVLESPVNPAEGAAS
jgi:hypothetical protein